MNNPNHIHRALDYLNKAVQIRLQRYFKQEVPNDALPLLPLPEFNGSPSHFADFLQNRSLSQAEFTTLLLALVPHVQPSFFDQLMLQFLPQGGDFPELGGVKGKQHRSFIPTGETAVFILAGSDLQARFEVQQLFGEHHFFTKENILELEELPSGEPPMSGKIVLSPSFVSLFTTGEPYRPRFGNFFPAKRISTQMDWEDLVLNPVTADQIEDIKTWMEHEQQLMQDWGMAKKLKPGYRSLFYGPPGTGKTLTATLLGKHTGKEVYKVDLSLVVSKYIGETEKNLNKVFDMAANKDWILFFDEADALFSKRTNIRDAHDKYANQEVSFLLQKLEDHNGLTILASNLKSNIDPAFARRFQSIIHFPMPTAGERFILWKKSLPEKVKLAEEANFEQLAEDYELSGASIMNVIQFACLKALKSGVNVVEKSHLLSGIMREYQKEGKSA